MIEFFKDSREECFFLAGHELRDDKSMYNGF